MSTTTHRITLAATAYTNVSNGNLHCTLIAGNNHVRLVVGGSEPAADTAEFVSVVDAVVSVQDLEAEDDMWVRAEAGEIEITVIRGMAKVTLGVFT